MWRNVLPHCEQDWTNGLTCAPITYDGSFCRKEDDGLGRCGAGKCERLCDRITSDTGCVGGCEWFTPTSTYECFQGGDGAYTYCNCPGGSFIDASANCDGKRDCPNGEDEPGASDDAVCGVRSR